MADCWDGGDMSDEEIQGFIDYFGEDKIPNPDHYPQRVIWLMKWYRHIVERNRKDNEKDECKDYTGQ